MSLTSNYSKIAYGSIFKVKEPKKPKAKPSTVKKGIKKTKLKFWATKGIKPSPTENKIISVLKKLGVRFLREVCFSGCVNTNTGQYFRYDFYIPSKRIIFEYDGDHHSEEYFVWADKIKNSFARKNKIKLYRINKYTLQQTEPIIKRKLGL